LVGAGEGEKEQLQTILKKPIDAYKEIIKEKEPFFITISPVTLP
jgi:hypothetical protein